MIYYGARQIPADEPTPDAGRWRYTKRIGNSWIAVGECATDDGHESADDADDCFTRWLTSNRTSFGLGSGGIILACQICGAETNRRADCQGRVFALCHQHMTPECVRGLVGRIGAYQSNAEV